MHSQAQKERNVFHDAQYPVCKRPDTSLMADNNLNKTKIVISDIFKIQMGDYEPLWRLIRFLSIYFSKIS